MVAAVGDSPDGSPDPAGSPLEDGDAAGAAVGAPGETVGVASSEDPDPERSVNAKTITMAQTTSRHQQMSTRVRLSSRMLQQDRCAGSAFCSSPFDDAFETN